MRALFHEFNESKRNDDELIAHLKTYNHSDFWYYWGYINGAEILYKDWISHFQSDGRHISIDAITQPIYTCYRLGIEIFFKKILRTMGVETAPNHDIQDLFNLLYQHSENIRYSAYYADVKLFIKLLQEHDPCFTRFRYDTMKNGKYPDTLDVDLVGMVNGFRKTYAILERVWRDKFEGDPKFIQNHHGRVEVIRESEMKKKKNQ